MSGTNERQVEWQAEMNRIAAEAIVARHDLDTLLDRSAAWDYQQEAWEQALVDDLLARTESNEGIYSVLRVARRLLVEALWSEQFIQAEMSPEDADLGQLHFPALPPCHYRYAPASEQSFSETFVWDRAVPPCAPAADPLTPEQLERLRRAIADFDLLHGTGRQDAAEDN